jgi:hypothetical protein
MSPPPFFFAQSQSDQECRLRRLSKVCFRRTQMPSGLSLADQFLIREFANSLAFLFKIKFIEGYGHVGTTTFRAARGMLGALVERVDEFLE